MPENTDAGQRLVAAARELFAERGYAATTTRAIAERAGVNEVTLFRRFTNKAGILRAIAAQFAEQAAGVAASSDAASSAADSPATNSPAAAPDAASPASASPAVTRSRLADLARMEITSAIDNGGLALRLALEARSVPEVAEVLGAGTAGNLQGLVGFLAAGQDAGMLRAELPASLLAEAFFALTSNLVMARLLLGASPPPDAAAVDVLATQLLDLFWSGACAQPAGPADTSHPPTGRPAAKESP